MIKQIQHIIPTAFHKYLQNISWLLFEKVLRVVETFFIGIWLARHFGPEEFGVFSYAQAFVFLFTAIAALGLDQIVVRQLVKTPEKHSEIMGTTLALRLVGFLGMLVLLSLSLFWLKPGTVELKLILILTLAVLFQVFNGIDFYFQSIVKSKYTAYANAIAISVGATLKVYAILNNKPLEFIAWAYCIEAFCMAFGYGLFYILKKNVFTQWRVSTKLAKALLSKSWPLIVGAFAISVYMKIDQVMIKEIQGDYEVGLYSVAVKACSIWLFVTMVITQSFFPNLVATRKKSVKLFLMRLQALNNALMKIAISIAILYTIFAKQIILLFFGQAYQESASVLILYVWSIVWVYLNNAAWGFYLNEGLEKFSSLRLVLGAVLNIVLNLIFIKKFGLLGAAYATLISYAFSAYLVNLCFSKTRKYFFIQSKALLNYFVPATWRNPFLIQYQE